MSSILLYHHLGLGDHFMCHGIVREYCKKYKKVGLFCLPQYYPSVSFMYRDLDNLTVIKGDDASIQEFIKQNTYQPEGLKYDEIKILGFQYLNKNSNIPLEMQFYQIANIPFNKKWDSFYIKRDPEREKILFDKVVPQNDYVFIHEDVSRNFVINRDFINKDCSVISADKSATDNVIDYCGVIEKAKEIHVIDSSLMFLVEFLQYNNPDQKLFIHRYARENHEWLLPVQKKDWRIFIDRYNNGQNLFKDLLTKLFGARNTIFKKIIRKIFKIMKWDMIKPKYPDLEALIKRYVYEKSFLTISPNSKNDLYLSIAKEFGATIANQSTIDDAYPADIVFYSGTFSQNKNQKEFLKKIHSITKSSVIFHTRNYDSQRLESILIEAGFETREKHLFPYEMYFICKAVLKT